MRELAYAGICFALAVPVGIAFGTALIPFYAYVMVRRSWIYRKSWPI